MWPPKRRGGPMSRDPSGSTRRKFLKFLAASPYVAAAGGIAAFLQQEGFAEEIKRSGFAESVHDRMSFIDDPRQALTVFYFEENARRKGQAGHEADIARSTNDDATLLANSEGLR